MKSWSAQPADRQVSAIVRTKPDALLILADRVFLHNRMMDFVARLRAARRMITPVGLLSSALYFPLIPLTAGKPPGLGSGP